MRFETEEKVTFGILGGLLAAVTLVTGYLICEDAQDPTAGTVISKEHTDAWTQVACTTVGKVTTCNPVYWPECWGITFSDGSDTGDTCVTREQFDNYQIGGQYP